MNAQQHTFTPRDIVTVFTRTIDGRFVIEGTAEIVCRRHPKDTYDVKFLNPLLVINRVRYVDPNGQADPSAYLDVLNIKNSPLTEAQQLNR